MFLNLTWGFFSNLSFSARIILKNKARDFDTIFLGHIPQMSVTTAVSRVEIVSTRLFFPDAAVVRNIICHTNNYDYLIEFEKNSNKITIFYFQIFPTSL